MQADLTATCGTPEDRACPQLLKASQEIAAVPCEVLRQGGRGLCCCVSPLVLALATSCALVQWVATARVTGVRGAAAQVRPPHWTLSL